MVVVGKDTTSKEKRSVCVGVSFPISDHALDSRSPCYVCVRVCVFIVKEAVQGQNINEEKTPLMTAPM